MVRHEFAQGTDVAGTAHVLCRGDLLEVADAVVDGDTVDVVDLHAGCAFAYPCFIDGNVTGLGMEGTDVLVVMRTTFVLAGSVRGVGGCLFGDGAFGDQKVLGLVINGFAAL